MTFGRLLALGLNRVADVQVEHVAFGVVVGAVEDQPTDMDIHGFHRFGSFRVASAVMIRPGCCSKLTTTKSPPARSDAAPVVTAPTRARVGLRVIWLGDGREHPFELAVELGMITSDLLLPDPRMEHDLATVRVGDVPENMTVAHRPGG